MLKRGPRSASRRNRLRMASVFLAFALLLVLFYIPGYWYVRGVTRQNALEYYRQRLLDGAKALDVTLSGLGNLQEMLNQNPLTRALGYPSSRTDMTAVDKVRDAVRIYLLPYAMAADAGLSRGEEILFTRRRVYHPREQLQAVHYFRSENLTTAQWLSKLSGPVSVLPEEAFRTVDYGAYRGFTVAWRWSRANDMYLFATFPTDKVFSLIADEGVLAAGHAAIAWGGRVIASSGASPAGAYEDLSAKADSLELEFSLRIPDAYIEQDLRQLHRLALSFLGVLVLASAVWVILGAVAASRPLNRVTDALYGAEHLRMDPPAPGQPLDLAEGIRSLDSRLGDYESTIAAQQASLRAHALEKALYRGLHGEEERAAFHAAYPLFPARWQMASIQYAPGDADVARGVLTLLVTGHLQRALPGAVLLPVDDDTLLAVLPAPDGESPAEAMETLREEMRARYGVLTSFSLSAPGADPSALAGAWQQLEYGAGQAMPGSGPRREKPPLTLSQLDAMYMALSCGDAKAALGMLEACADALLPAQDFFLCQHTYRMIASMLVMVRLEATCDLGDIPIPPFDPKEIRRLYTQDLPGCFRSVAERILTQRKSFARSLDRAILDFIGASLTNPSLSIGMVTDRFQISAPTLQKRLHALTGQTFSAYVEEARMNMARQALRDTALPVQDIAEKCGYATPNSFYKAYKRRFGEAPLEVRK